MTAAIRRDGGNDMTFSRIIDFRTSNLEAVSAGSQSLGRCHGRQVHGTAAYLVRAAKRSTATSMWCSSTPIESAVENSNLPQTHRLSQEMMSFTADAPTFDDVDIIEDRS
jgi:hypothetical protein